MTLRQSLALVATNRRVSLWADANRTEITFPNGAKVTYDRRWPRKPVR